MQLNQGLRGAEFYVGMNTVVLRLGGRRGQRLQKDFVTNLASDDNPSLARIVVLHPARIRPR